MFDNTNSQYWRGRAEKTRALAMKDPRSEYRMIRLADFYEHLAEQIEQQRTWKRRASPGSK
jgi:hypothetical protein